ncbi:MAG: response regulator [Desulfobulbaceae bacterium]|nr:MAG: response regulator [Desulfobulbaceae bacterium]
MKVLIVEDEQIAQELLKGFLEAYDAVWQVAANGVQGVAAFKEALAGGEPFDLILLDIMMPQMDGQQALREIRHFEAEQGIGGTDMVKIAMVTALSDAKSVMEALVKGSCEAYLTKPVYPQQLHRVLVDFGLVESE